MTFDFVWSKWYESRYRAKTFWFSDIRQDGIYRSLLGHYLESGPLPLDEDELRALCRNMAKPEWDQFWPKIRERFFFEKNGRLHNKKADEVRDEQRSGPRKKSKAGKEGARVRWERKRAQDSGEAPPDPLAEAKAAIDAYNAAAEMHGWPVCAKASKARLGKLRARLADAGGIEGWKTALEKAAASDFLMGRAGRNDTHRNWKLDLDFLLQESSFTKLMEGKYDNRSPGAGGPVSIGKGHSPTVDERRAAIAEGLGLAS